MRYDKNNEGLILFYSQTISWHKNLSNGKIRARDTTLHSWRLHEADDSSESECRVERAPCTGVPLTASDVYSE